MGLDMGTSLMMVLRWVVTLALVIGAVVLVTVLLDRVREVLEARGGRR